MDIILGFLGAVVGSGIALATLMLILPLYGTFGIFVNKPNGLMKSGFHIFTTLEPGNVKIIVRGKKLVRMVMNTPGLMFERKGEEDSDEYWQIVEALGFTENPVVDVWLPLRGWAQLVYDKTGLVFTGLYPIQRVREYEIERTKFPDAHQVLQRRAGQGPVARGIAAHRDAVQLVQHGGRHHKLHVRHPPPENLAALDVAP